MTDYADEIHLTLFGHQSRYYDFYKYFGRDFVAHARDTARSHGGFFTSGTEDGLGNSRHDAYRHALMQGELIRKIMHSDPGLSLAQATTLAKIIGDDHEVWGGNPVEETNMDLINNQRGRDYYAEWKAGFDSGSITDSFDKFVYDKVLSGDTVNAPTTTPYTGDVIDLRTPIFATGALVAGTLALTATSPLLAIVFGSLAAIGMWEGNPINPYNLLAQMANPNPSFMDSILSLFGLAEQTATPLILDLDGDGVETTNLVNTATGGVGANAVYWDIDNDGFREASAWVGSDGSISFGLCRRWTADRFSWQGDQSLFAPSLGRQKCDKQFYQHLNGASTLHDFPAYVANYGLCY